MTWRGDIGQVGRLAERMGDLALRVGRFDRIRAAAEESLRLPVGAMVGAIQRVLTLVEDEEREAQAAAAGAGVGSLRASAEALLGRVPKAAVVTQEVEVLREVAVTRDVVVEVPVPQEVARVQTRVVVRKEA